LINLIIVALFFIFVSLTSIPMFLLACLVRVITHPFDRRLVILHQLTCFWASLYSWLMPSWRLTITGRDKIKRDTAYVIVCNHQSLLDILLIFRLFFHFKVVSKSEIFKVPLIGWNMYLNRYIKLIRGDKASIGKMMKDCEDRLDEGSSVFIFPEGTRSLDGVMRPFKLGAFKLAGEKKAPILPVVICGTEKALPKNSIDYHGTHRIIIQICDEIPYSSFENLTAEETAIKVREFMMGQLEELKKGEPRRAM